MAQAPRRAPQAQTVNDKIRDRGIAHAVYLERLKRSEAERVVRFLDTDVIPDLLEKLGARLVLIEERGWDIGPATTKRLQDMVGVMQETVDAWSTGLSADLAERSERIGVAEARWQDEAVQAVLPIQWDTVIPPTPFIAAAVVQSPIDGVLLKDIVGKLGNGTKAHLEKAIRIGIAEGESIDRIARRVRDVGDFSKRSAEAVVRTAVGHASSLGREAYYSENQDLIKKVQWVATLDTRTCPSCRALDGKVYEHGKGPRPPRHISCRCSSAPVLKSLRELGFDVDDFPPSTRASMNGQVSETETYATWLRKMPATIQDEALGPTRGKLFRAGKLEVGDFVDRGGDPYTLEELRRRERAAWKAAGL